MDENTKALGSGEMMHKFIYLIATESRLKIKSKYSQTHPLFTITVQREFANDNSRPNPACLVFGWTVS